MTTKIGEYKGHKMISLIEEGKEETDKYLFSFGIKKAKLILENIEDIKKFVEDNKD